MALLCIAADDGIMPQTEEHLAVLQLLAMPLCVVALTKCDLVDEEWALFMEDEVRTRLAGTPYARRPRSFRFPPRTGQGLDKLREAIQLAARGTAGHAEQEAMRLPVDRSFTIKRRNRWLTGTLWATSRMSATRWGAALGPAPASAASRCMDERSGRPRRGTAAR